MELAPRTILVLNHRHMGDVLCSFPALLALRRRWPEARIINVAPPMPLSVLPTSGLSDRNLALRKGWRSVLRTACVLRGEKPDLAICLAMVRRMRVLARLSGAPERVGYAGGKSQDTLTKTVDKFIAKSPPWLDDDLHLVESLSCPAVQRHIVGLLALTPEERGVAEHFWQESGCQANERVIAFNLGASDMRRHWGTEKFAEVANALAQKSGVRVLVIGGPEDASIVERFQFLLHCPAMQSAGRFSIRETAALLERCELLVTNDTGPMHLAVAVNTPVVALFGPVAATHRLPSGYGHIGLEKNASCRQLRAFGCHNEKTCSLCECLLSITPEEVIAAATTLL